MSERAKQVAAAIIADVWPKYPCGKWLYDAIESSLEKHLPRPHQVRDRDGCAWEQVSNGLYLLSSETRNRWRFDQVEKEYGPLITIQGEPMPDAGEIAKLKERIAELEKLSAKLEESRNEIGSKLLRAETRSAELEIQLADKKTSDRAKQITEQIILAVWKEYSKDGWIDDVIRPVIDAAVDKHFPEPQAIWQQISDGELVYGVPVRGVVRERKSTVVKRPSGWDWTTHGSYGSGTALNRIAAIDAAEKSMGVK